ncbi:eIF2A-related protein [Leptothoe spongobia]|uniref:NB-ARC domain-containing protein n=1 Tax=Leptothoe spongobia TAU-MAC 1115 TaxID=1967444 RepID=A0A947DCE9_9CYAN|nr:NB-ARC domain-containing protein [Leptothoe spongobia]MBT9314570.1 hypothetical protein [Leptothoe spongobia TAU-MAC 1115]
MNVEDAFTQVEAAITAQGGQRLTTLQKAILESAWFGQSYKAVAAAAYCTEGHVKDVAADFWKQLSAIWGEKVGKKNFKAMLTAQVQTDSPFSIMGGIQRVKPIVTQAYDWGDIPDVSHFLGRDAELTRLKSWILQDSCRLVALLGMGGIGKTALAASLARQLQADFDKIIWRSLRNAPQIDLLLAELIPFLSGQSAMALAPHLDGQLLQLLECLQTNRCLIILDNAESVLSSGAKVGVYRSGYEGYGQLLRTIGTVAHNSCLILTSREEPQGLKAIAGKKLPVRCLVLHGVPLAVGQAIFQAKGKFSGTQAQWQLLTERYGGNPLAFKIVAVAIADFFDHSLTNFLDFLQQGPFIFEDIRSLLAQQFERLSPREQAIMYWLAINREPMTFQALQTDLIHPGSNRELFQALASLQHRSLIEKNAVGFSQQPVVMEYLIDRFIDQVTDEISQGKPILFNQHALVKAQSKDYIRTAQTRLILLPTIEKLALQFAAPQEVVNRLTHLLENLRIHPPDQGYAGGNILNLLRQLQGDLSGYNFSSLTIRQANLQDICLHNVNFANADLSQSTFSETLGSILSVALNPTGNLLICGDIEGHIYLWQMPTGQRLLSYSGHLNWIRSVAFHPHGQTFASGSYDHTLRLWSVDHSNCLKTFQGHQRGICTIAFSPDGRILASGSADETIKLWDVDRGTCLKTLTGHNNWVNALSFHPDNRILTSGSTDGTIRLWDTATGDCLTTLTGHTLGVTSVAFSPDGQTLLSGSSDHTLKLWQVSQGQAQEQCLKTLSGHTDTINTISVSFDGQYLASGSADQTIKLWNSQTGQCLKTLTGHRNDIWSLAFSPVDHTLISGSADQTIKLWDGQTGQCDKTISGYTHWINSIAFSPNGETLISGGFGQTLGLWHPPTGQYQKTLIGHTAPICSVAFKQDNSCFASGSADQSIRLWHGQTGDYLQQLTGHHSWVCSVAFSPDGKHLASGSFDHTVKLWDLDQSSCTRTLTGHNNVVWSVAFNPLDHLLASGSADHTIKLWNSQTGQCQNTLREHDNVVWSIAFAPTGSTLASGSADQTIKLWDAQTGTCVTTLAGHTSWVCAVTFSHQGHLLASSSADHSIRIWNLNTLACDQVLTGHTHGVYTIAFSADDQTLASGSQDGTLKCWHVKTGKLLNTLRPPRLYEGMNIHHVRGLTTAQRFTLKALGAVD